MPPIYTKTGDQGETGLLGQVRVSKASARIEAIGAVDELNAAIGVARAILGQGVGTGTASGAYVDVMLRQQPKHLGPNVDTKQDPSQSQDDKLDQWLATLQSHLFSIGAELASPNGGHEDVTEADVVGLEHQIDSWTSELPALTRFILPGGSLAGAELHRARAVCRRAERALVGLNHAEPDRPLRPELLRFVNRLSDALFTAARWVNHQSGVVETIWQGNNHE